jgi:hypothetical protein
MSTALAVPAVTAVLKVLLEDGMKALHVSDIVGGDVSVSALPPDRVSTPGAEDPSQLNLFLYQVTPNQGWRNVGLPSRNPQGERISNPPLALNLHYLLTAYGAKDFFAETLLGNAMQLLHETPTLTREAIRKALTPPPPPSEPRVPAALAGSNLADQVEQLKITLDIMSTEEISKLWSALQAHYRPTAAYQVTVVLIEGNHSTKTSLPVLDRNAYVLPFDNPVIEKVTAAEGEDTPITVNSKLHIVGKGLRADKMQILIGGIDLSSAMTKVGDSKIELQLPVLPPAGLYAGVQPVQLIHQLMMGTPETAHYGFTSNLAAFVLRPTIVAAPLPGASSSVVDGVTIKEGEIRIDFTPKVAKRQRVVLLLNELAPPPNRSARAYSFSAPEGNGVTNTDTASIIIHYKTVAAGDYLVRVQVDGAESTLGVDSGGKYSSPKLTI